MLSSTAKNLYWLGRYIERAENTARVLEAASRIAVLSPPGPQAGREWHSVAGLYGCEADFESRHPNPTLDDFLAYMTLFADNPASILSSVRAARSNARAERNNLTTDVWENLNGFWLEIAAAAEKPAGQDWRALHDWVRKQTTLVTGAIHNTLLRDESLSFLLLGIYLERADSTARLLDVRHHLLLPQGEAEGGAIDYYQWVEILNGVSAFRVYRRVYASRIEPRRVAELMLLNEDLPRSVHYAYRMIDQSLEEIAQAHGRRHECHRMAGEMYAQLRYGRIETVLENGLHEFLTSVIERNAALSDRVALDYLMT